MNNLGEDEPLQKEVLEIFKNTLRYEIIKIKKAYKLKNWSTLEKSVHKLKGSAAYAGAVRFDYVCKNFLKCYTKGKIKYLDSLYKTLEVTLEETAKALKLAKV